MVGWMQKHRRTRWLGGLFVVLSFVAPLVAQAAVVTVPLTFEYSEIGGPQYTTTVATYDAAGCREGAMRRCEDKRYCWTGNDVYALWHFSIGGNGANGDTCYWRNESSSGWVGSIRFVCAFQDYSGFRYNLNNKTCERDVPDTLTITLSGGTSVEPWHKKADADHKKTNLPYAATVKEASGQPATNIEVTITTEVTQDSGGHVHIDGRHKGKLAIPSDPIKDGTKTITGNTDVNGVYSFVFGSEEASGTHTITATCKGCSNNPQTAEVKVAIQGLSLLDRNPLSYTLNGETSTHPGSHYFSAAALTKIINLAFKFSHDPLFNKQLLIINDSSLIKGGVFDLGQDWTYTPNGHQGHRKGVVVDINNFQAEDPDFDKFVEYLNSGIQAQWHSRGTAPHYHLLLLGKDE